MMGKGRVEDMKGGESRIAKEGTEPNGSKTEFTSM